MPFYSMSQIALEIIDLMESRGLGVPFQPQEQEQINLLADAWLERTGYALTFAQYDVIKRVYGGNKDATEGGRED